MSILVDHWRELEGSIHPEDAPFFERHPHTFNLDWPPPAYIGDIEKAPVVMLMMNGGYHRTLTPAEFPDQAAIDRYLDLLRNPRPVNPRDVSPYYDSGNYGHLIANGKLALVNAVPYRSVAMSQEPENKRLANILPSTLVHRRWLRQEMIPQALAGDRVILAHRNGMWNLTEHEHTHPHIVFTPNARAKNLPAALITALETFRANH